MNIGKYSKAIAAFVSLVATNLAYRVTSGETPLPALDDYKGWGVLVLTTVAGTFITWAKGNTGYVEADKTHKAESPPEPPRTRRRPVI